MESKSDADHPAFEREIIHRREAGSGRTAESPLYVDMRKGRPLGPALPVAAVNGTDRSRTDDLLRVKQVLFQLSYDPKFNSFSLLWFADLCQEMSAC